MKDFLKSVLASAIGTFLAGVMTTFLVLTLFIALISLASNRPDKPAFTLKDNSLLVIGNGLVINDTPQYSAPSLESLISKDNTPEVDLLRAVESIRLAAQDRNICGILLAGKVSAGLTQLSDLRQALEAFKKSGKPVIAWIENASQSEYYLASVAQKIYCHPAGEVEFKGLKSYNAYFGDTLKSLGVGVQVTRVGKYKSAVEPFTENHMSEASREQTELLLSGAWKKILYDVSQSRNLTPEKLNRIVNAAGIFSSQEAVELKLVDGLLQRDELISKMHELGATPEEGKTTFRQVSLSKYSNKVSFTKSSNHIAVVYAEGEIVDGWGDPDQVGGDRLAHYLRDIRSNKQIKAVVLRINSPGGSAFASDIIAREIQLLRKKGIPVVVSMGDVAASGGYYIAARGTKILANNSTITGSIGVFGLHFNFEELAKKINLGVDGSKTSRYADLLSSHRIATPEEIALVQKLVDRVYDDFVGIVAEGRSLERDKVHAIAQGRVWLGLNAKENGLVDSFGNLTDAIQLSQKLAKIDQAEIVQYPSLHEGRSNFLQKLLSDEEEEPFLFTSTATNNPAMQFIRAHWDRLKQIKSYNDPQGVYLTCPMQVGEK